MNSTNEFPICLYRLFGAHFCKTKFFLQVKKSLKYNFVISNLDNYWTLKTAKGGGIRNAAAFYYYYQKSVLKNFYRS